jgi:hypothetical protein
MALVTSAPRERNALGICRHADIAAGEYPDDVAALVDHGNASDAIVPHRLRGGVQRAEFEQHFTSVAIKSLTFMALASLQFEKRVIGDHELMQVMHHC